jgi:acyl-CoA hydrolase
MKIVASVEEALEQIKAGSHILIHSACAEPQTLVEGLIAGIRDGQSHLQNLTLYALTYRGAGAPAPLYGDAALLREGKFRLRSFFPHSTLREASRAGLVDYIPASLSMVPGLIRQGFLKFDFALLQITPPDETGLCSTGPSSDMIEALLDVNVPLIGEINQQMPFTYGPLIPAERFLALVESNRPLVEMPSSAVGPVEQAVAANVAELIPDGATLQFGVGTIPDAVLELLTVRKNLNLHSGAFSDGVVGLIESGAVTNAGKPFDQGQSVTGFLLGTKRLFDYAHRNPLIRLAGADYTNSQTTIAQLPNFISINSALEIDYWGQVNAEALGEWQLAGIGGQLDYIQGAWNVPGGLSIIALPSATANGKPRIVPRLSSGTPVSTPRHVTQVVVTEKGVADLRGKSLSEREKLLKAIG